MLKRYPTTAEVMPRNRRLYSTRSVTAAALLCASVGSTSVPKYTAQRLVPFVNVTFASLNVTTLRARSMPYDPRPGEPDATWVMTSTCCGYGNFTEAAVTAASNKYGLFDLPCFWETMPQVAEWGYEFHNNGNGIFPVCGNLTEAGYAKAPSDRAEALARVAAYWNCRAATARNESGQNTTAPVLSEVGHYLYAAISASVDVGAVLPGVEVRVLRPVFVRADPLNCADGAPLYSALYSCVPTLCIVHMKTPCSSPCDSQVGENINSINAHISHVRGAARQFGAPYLLDFSPWMQGYILDYSTPPGFWGAASSPVGGHSLSLFHRTYVAAYMAGASSLSAEAGAVNWFLPNTTADGVLALSPLGEIGRTVFAFSHRGAADGGGSSDEQRGVPYVPTALITEMAWGAGLGWFYNNKAFDVFPLTDAEHGTMAWLSSLWPASFTVETDFSTPKSEHGYMVGGPYGDSVDLLIPRNVTAALLSTAYRVVIVSGLGEGDFNFDLARSLQGFVSGGGTVIIAAADAVVARQQGWLNASFFGVDLPPTQPPRSASATAVRDVQTAWQASAPGAGVPVTVYDAGTAGTALPLLEVTLSDGSTAPAAVVNYNSSGGSGTVILLLASSAAFLSDSPPGGSLGVASHLLQRLQEDVAPFDVNATRADGSPVQLQVLTNRTPRGWLLTLINNNGITKAPGTPTVTDASAACTASIFLRSGWGVLASAWASVGAALPTLPIPVVDGAAIRIDNIGAGELVVVGVTMSA